MDNALKKLYQMRMLSLVFENYAFLIDDFKVALAVVTKAVVFFNLLSVLGISNRVIRNRSASYRRYFIDYRFQWADSNIRFGGKFSFYYFNYCSVTRAKKILRIFSFHFIKIGCDSMHT